MFFLIYSKQSSMRAAGLALSNMTFLRLRLGRTIHLLSLQSQVQVTRTGFELFKILVHLWSCVMASLRSTRLLNLLISRARGEPQKSLPFWYGRFRLVLKSRSEMWPMHSAQSLCIILNGQALLSDFQILCVYWTQTAHLARVPCREHTEMLPMRAVIYSGGSALAQLLNGWTTIGLHESSSSIWLNITNDEPRLVTASFFGMEVNRSRSAVGSGGKGENSQTGREKNLRSLWNSSSKIYRVILRGVPKMRCIHAATQTSTTSQHSLASLEAQEDFTLGGC